MSINRSNHKILYLLRHAKSSWTDPSLSDFERPLNKCGVQQISQIAAILTAKEAHPQLIISSPASRAFSTAKPMAVSIGSDELRISSDNRVYEAKIQSLMYLIREFDENLDNIMLVGHNPGLSHLINTLSRQKVVPLPTCALVQLRLNINHWHELDAECAELISVDIPSRIQK